MNVVDYYFSQYIWSSLRKTGTSENVSTRWLIIKRGREMLTIKNYPPHFQRKDNLQTMHE